MKDNKLAFTSEEYDNKINNVLPYYSEYHAQIIDLIRTMDFKNFSWLDTGCGTGNLEEKAAPIFKDCKFTLCDISENMIDIAKKKLEDLENVEYNICSSENLQYKNAFDVVTAIQSHHYFNEEQRKKATINCYNVLKTGGVYITFENIKSETDICDKIQEKRWQNYLAANGKTKEEAVNHTNRRGVEVLSITVSQHLQLLKDAGFKHIDILWKSYLQAGFFAIK